jgi:hypothetical protein
MPLDLEIIRVSEFIRFGAHGRLDLAASREVLSQLAIACWRRGIHRALLDLRDVRPEPTPMLTTDDLAVLVNTFREAGFATKQRLAVLYSADPHRRARLFAFLSTLHGWNVKASDNFEELLQWLSRGEGAEQRKQAGEQEIPVRTKRAAGPRAPRPEARKSTRKENEIAPLPIRSRPARQASR